MCESTAPGTGADLVRPRPWRRRGCRCTSLPTNWMSMGALMPKFRIWLTMSAGWKKNSMPGKCLGQFLAQLGDVTRRRAMVLLVERAEDFHVGGADGAVVGVGRVDAAVGQADVVDDRADLLRRDLRADELLDLIGGVGRFLDARGRCGCACAGGTARRPRSGRNPGRWSAAAPSKAGRSPGTRTRTSSASPARPPTDPRTSRGTA